MEDIPCALVLSSSETPPEEIIKLVIEKPELPPRKTIAEGIYAYRWDIVNKYYSAEVHLCTVGKYSALNDKFYELLYAVVLHFDPAEEDFIQKLDKWSECIRLLSPELKMLVCKELKSVDDDKKNLITDWCRENSYELVELEPVLDEGDGDGDGEEDYSNEPYGIKAVIDSLHTVSWPNMVLQTSVDRIRARPKARYHEPLDIEEPFLTSESLETFLDEDDFSQLFSKFVQLKERVESLEGDEKKAAAEAVVKAFCKALGEDEDEF